MAYGMPFGRLYASPASRAGFLVGSGGGFRSGIVWGLFDGAQPVCGQNWVCLNAPFRADHCIPLPHIVPRNIP